MVIDDVHSMKSSSFHPDGIRSISAWNHS